MLIFLGVNICPANFTETLENGVVLCQLAKLIEQKAGEVLGAKVTNILANKSLCTYCSSNF